MSLVSEGGMAAPGIAAISVSLEGYSGSGKVATPALLAAMLRAAEKISDLIFSPGRPPQVQVYGQLIPVQVPGLSNLTPDDTRHIAVDLIGDNKQAVATLREHGSCDVSLRFAGGRALSCEYLYPARQLRHCDARHLHADPRSGFA